MKKIRRWVFPVKKGVFCMTCILLILIWRTTVISCFVEDDINFCGDTVPFANDTYYNCVTKLPLVCGPLTVIKIEKVNFILFSIVIIPGHNFKCTSKTNSIQSKIAFHCKTWYLVRIQSRGELSSAKDAFFYLTMPLQSQLQQWTEKGRFFTLDFIPSYMQEVGGQYYKVE